MITGADRLCQLDEYFFSVKLKEIALLRQSGKDIINLGIGSPDMAPSEKVVQALNDSAKISTHHGYQPYHGTSELRKAIALWMEREYKVRLNADNEILPLLGSKEGILHISLAFLNPGDTVAIPALAYPAYRSITSMVYANIVEYPLDSQWQPDWKNMSHCKGAKLLWLNYPNMPTGACEANDTFKKAVAFGLENQVLICHDNPYSHVLNDSPKSILSIENSLQVCLELHSLSKSHSMAGWRVGWLTGHQEYLQKVLRIKSNIDSGMFRGIQDAAIEALALDSSWHIDRNKEYARRQSLAYLLLDKFGCSYKNEQSGLFVWGQLPGNQDARVWSEDLLSKHGIFVTPGFIFGDMGKNFIRVSLCVSENRLTEALMRLEN